MTSDQSQNIHATCVKLGEAGCLIRGESGSGKSLLALELLDYFGEEGKLIADDQTLISIESGKLIATCPPALQGKIELHGRGIIEWPTIDQCTIEFVIDLEDTRERMPHPSAFSCDLFGVQLRRIPVPNHRLSDLNHQRMLVQAALLYD